MTAFVYIHYPVKTDVYEASLRVAASSAPIEEVAHMLESFEEIGPSRIRESPLGQDFTIDNHQLLDEITRMRFIAMLKGIPLWVNEKPRITSAPITPTWVWVGAPGVTIV